MKDVGWTNPYPAIFARSGDKITVCENFGLQILTFFSVHCTTDIFELHFLKS